MARSALMTIMVKAAMKAGRSLRRDFGEIENLQIARKSPADFVSKADLKAEKIIQDALSYARPDFSFLMEESGKIEGADTDHRWIIDPLDGTTNFLHGIPEFAVSIALEAKGRIIAGVIFSPIHDELYTAERGKGAFVNNRRLRVSARTKLVESVITTGIPHFGRGEHGAYLRELAAIMRTSSGIRRFGAASLDLAYIASGRCDGYWESHLSPWDMAAGIIMVREAGGFVADHQGGDAMLEKGSIIAGNEAIKNALLKTLKAARNPKNKDA